MSTALQAEPQDTAIEKSVDVLACERKTYVDLKKQYVDLIKAVDEVLRPKLADMRASKNPGVPFSETHEWRMKADTAKKPVYNPLKLIRVLERAGFSEADIEALFEKSTCKVNDKVLEVLTREDQNLKRRVANIRDWQSARTGSIYEGRRK